MHLKQTFFNSSQGPQQREIGTPISTGNASWGGAPTQRISKKEILQAVQVGGAPTQRISKKEILQAMQVGGAPT
ncbi:TPA: hypothetical protein ACURE2_001986 [Staphylococcus aureus]